MAQDDEFDRELFDSVRGVSYGHQICVHKLVAAGQRPLVLADSNVNTLADLAAIRADTESHSTVQVRLWPTATPGNITTPLEIRTDAIHVPAVDMGMWRLRPLGSDLAFELNDNGTYSIYVTLNQLLGGTSVGNALTLGRWRIRPTGDDLIIERMNDNGVYVPKMQISDN